MSHKSFSTLLLASFVVATMVGEHATASDIPAYFTLDAVNSNVQFTLMLDGNPLPIAALPCQPDNMDGIANQGGPSNGPPLDHMHHLVGAIGVDDFTMGSYDLVNLVLELGLGVGPYPGNGTNPGTVDLSGLPINIAGGSLMSGVTTVIDFSADPLLAVLPAASLAYFEEIGSGPHYDLILDIPVDVSGAQLIGGMQVEFAMAGNLRFTGGKDVPEPQTALLATIGVLALAAIARRRTSSR